MVDASFQAPRPLLAQPLAELCLSSLHCLLTTNKPAQWRAQDRSGREDASRCYVDALQHDKPDIPLLVTLYAKTNRMHVISSPQVVESAELVMRRIIDTYFEPDRTFTQLRSMVTDGSLDIIRNFSEKSRAEFDNLRAQQF